MTIQSMLTGALCLLLSVTACFGQDCPPVKFGKITAKDFDLTGRKFDTSVNAVIIADVGNTEFEGNTKGWFTLMFKRQKRIKILNKNGFDAANVSVLLYNDGAAEELLDNLRATTYNLEDGKIIETKLEAKDVFKEKLSEHVIRKKFTFPAVKAGTVIEYSYTIASDFLFNLQPWTFQDQYPCLWSEYRVGMPQFFDYVSLVQGYHSFFIKTKKESYRAYNIIQPNTSGGSSNHITLNGQLTDARWVMKDVPAIKAEAYTSSLSNHFSKIEFQLSQYRFPDMPVKSIMGNWVSATEELLKAENFGEPIEKDNNWLADEVKAITANSNSPREKAQKIYAYVRDNFTCTQFNAVRMRNTLRAVVKSKNGSVAEINLLLVAMLRIAKISADPLILSTRDHGFANEFYPLMDRFNYVIVAAAVDNEVYYLDATRPLGFGKLSEDCYNGVARVISKNPGAVYFDADSLKESKMTTVFILNNEEGAMEGHFRSSLGFAESEQVRRKVKEGGQASFFGKIRSAYGDDLTISNEKVDSLSKLEDPVAIGYNFLLKNREEDLLYFNPLLSEGYKENLFKAAERNYPVEMPYLMNETFVLNMDVPAHYEIDELPKSARVNFNENEGFFEYMIGKTTLGQVQLRSRIVLNKANFQPEDYNTLREFFAYIVKKHGEQIVLKKKS